jgi:hypothetical protein
LVATDATSSGIWRNDAKFSNGTSIWGVSFCFNFVCFHGNRWQGNVIQNFRYFFLAFAFALVFRFFNFVFYDDESRDTKRPYKFAWDEDVDKKSDITISSVHTSDLSLFEDLEGDSDDDLFDSDKSDVDDDDKGVDNLGIYMFNHLWHNTTILPHSRGHPYYRATRPPLL